MALDIANETIYNEDDSVTIKTGAGDDAIDNIGNIVLINAGAGNDTINNIGESVTIDGGAGDDIINVISPNVSIFGGTGKDEISNIAQLILDEETGEYETVTYGDITIDAGAGDDYIENVGSSVTINGGADNDTIYNEGENVSINGNDGNDEITNFNAKNVEIIGGAGNDSIVNYAQVEWNEETQSYDTIATPDNVTIQAGAGDDTIHNNGSNVIIDAGAGNNSIYSSGENVSVKVDGGQNTVEGNVTLRTGNGNDSVTLNAGVQIYQYSGGNDVITNYSGEDTIQLSSGKIDSYSFDGGDLIFHIGKGSLRLKNMTNHAINVTDSSGKTSAQIYSNGYSQQQVIKNLIQAWSKTLLYGQLTEQLNESIKLCSHFNSIQEVVDQMVADCRAAGDADTFLRDYCGINFDNDDTGAITGWDAGGLKIKTADNIIGETLSSLKHVPDYTDTTFKTSQGVTINISSTGDSLTADGKKVFDGLYSWWAEEAIKLIEESYDVKFKEGNEINFSLVPTATAGFWGITESDNDVTINMEYTTFNSDDDYNGSGVDRTIAHEFTHVAQNLLIGKNSYIFPEFLIEGLAELTCGIDDKRGYLMRALANNADALARYLNVNASGTGDEVYYAAGYMFYRYFAKQAADSYDSLKSYAWEDKVSIGGTSAAELLTGSGTNLTISAGAGNDTITAYGKEMKVFGEAGDDYIANSGDYVSINGGLDKDFLINGDYYGVGGNYVSMHGGADDDTLSNNVDKAALKGGTGNDLIYNGYSYENTAKDFFDMNINSVSGGDDSTITGGAGNDTINNHGTNVSINSDEGDDYILNNGNAVLIDGGADNDEIYNYGTKSTITGGAGNDTIHNNQYRQQQEDGTEILNSPDDVLIEGGAGNDSITNSGENVTISGGTGNDTIINFGSNVQFNYESGDGNDFIYGFDSTSTLILNSDYSTVKNGYDIILKTDSNSITLSGAADLSDLNIEVEKGNLTSRTFDNKDDADVTLLSKTKVADASKRTKAIKITGNALDNSIIGGSNNDTLDGAAGDDTLTGGKGNDLFIYNGGKDIITDYGTGTDKISVASANESSFSVNGSDVIFDYGNNDSLTIENGAGKAININSKANYYTADGLLDGKQKLITLSDATKIFDASKAKLYSKLVTISGSSVTGSLEIIGNKKANKIYAGTGGATLNGGKGNDTLRGGDGADVFIYEKNSGKDVIESYGTGDVISLGSGATIKDAMIKNRNAVIKIGSGSITVKNTSEITLMQGDNAINFSNGVFIDDDSAKVYGSFKGTINLSDYKVTNTDASLAKKAVTLIGDAKNNSLTGGKGRDSINGGAGDDTLSGGKGNDSLWGGGGADTFLYSKGDGKDIIYDFDSDDLLKISGTFSASYDAGKNEIAFKVKSGSVTLKDFTTTEFNINNATWRLSKGTFRQK